VEHYILKSINPLILFGIRKNFEQWKKPIIVQNYKKGDKNDCGNY
jgi:hypothetical protein